MIMVSQDHTGDTGQRKDTVTNHTVTHGGKKFRTTEAKAESLE